MKRKISSDIEKIKKQKQLNVQEQNVLLKHKIFTEAQYWREIGISQGLLHLFQSKGIDFSKILLLEYTQDVLGGGTDEGIVVTEDAVFIEFEADFNYQRTELIELHIWADISETYEISKHKKGVGKTYGFLAMEVLSEINKKNDR